MNHQIIEIERYKPNLDNPGYLTFLGYITVKELYDEIEKRWKAIAISYQNEPSLLYNFLDYFRSVLLLNIIQALTIPLPIPNHKALAIYAVTGSNEGHYIHIDAIDNDTRSPLIVGKTFCA